MNYLLFIVVYFYLSNWFQIHAFLASFFKSNNRSLKVKDKWISDLVYKKAGLKLSDVYLYNSEKPFGMMPGIPQHPHMILSTKLYKNFNKRELEWIVLHEAGHCVLYHTFKIGGAMITIFISGIYMIHLFKAQLTPSFILAVLLSIIFVQVARIFERETDYFAAKHISNPKGMISAARKLASFYFKNRWSDLIKKFFGWNVLPDERIAIAEREISRRI